MNFINNEGMDILIIEEENGDFVEVCGNNNELVKLESENEKRKKIFENPSYLCSICLESYEHFPITTICGHIFCVLCLYKHVKIYKKKHCPNCRCTIDWKNCVGLNF